MVWTWEDTDEVLHAHLKMTGQFLVLQDGQTKAGILPLLSRETKNGKKMSGGFQDKQDEHIKEDKHTHLKIEWDNGKECYYRDIRKFGYIKRMRREEHNRIWEKYGPDAFNEEISFQTLRDKIGKRKKPLKSFLLDQHCIAGIGNIYADEICFRSGIHPLRRIDRVDDLELQSIAESITWIIKEATENKGTTLSDYYDADGEKGSYSSFLKVYGREGEACTRCDNSSVTKVQVLGRGTHFCDTCQQ